MGVECKVGREEVVSVSNRRFTGVGFRLWFGLGLGLEQQRCGKSAAPPPPLLPTLTPTLTLTPTPAPPPLQPAAEAHELPLPRLRVQGRLLLLQGPPAALG